MTPNRRLGFYDSGIGGLSVLRRYLPDLAGYEIFYLSQSQHFPYADEPSELAQSIQQARSIMQESECEKQISLSGILRMQAALDSRTKPDSNPAEIVHASTRTSSRVGVVCSNPEIGSKWFRASEHPSTTSFVSAISSYELVKLVEASLERSEDHVAEVRRISEQTRELQIDEVVLACSHSVHLEDLFRRCLGPLVKLRVASVLTNEISSIVNLKAETNHYPAIQMLVPPNKLHLTTVAQKYLQIPVEPRVVREHSKR